MDKFKLRRDEDGEIIECDSCQCEVPTILYEDLPQYNNRPVCEFCFSTMAGKMTEELQSKREPLKAEIWKAAAAVANHIKFGS